MAKYRQQPQWLTNVEGSTFDNETEDLKMGLVNRYMYDTAEHNLHMG